MTNPAKRKGTTWETDVAVFFSGGGEGVTPIPAERTGSADADLSDIRLGKYGEWLLECKNQQTIDLPAYLRQLERSKARAGVLPLKAAVVVKNRRHGTGEGYAVMRLSDFRQLVNYVMALEEVIERVTGEDLSALGWDYSVPVEEMAEDVSAGALGAPDA